MLTQTRWKTIVFACSLALAAPSWGQVRKLHTRDLTRLSQVQVADYLKRSDIVFVPIGAVETNGIMASDRDYVSQLDFAMHMLVDLYENKQVGLLRFCTIY